MARNGPTGQTARAPARRQAPEEQFEPGQGGANWPPTQAYPEQQGQGFYYPQAGDGDPGYGFAAQGAAQQGGFNGYQAQPAPAYAPAYAQPQQLPTAWGQQADPRGFDLGNYMPAQQGYPQAAQPHAPLAHEGHFGAPQQEYGDGEADYDDGMGEEEDEPRTGRRGAVILAALVAAIALGGAMAYTYKAFIGGGGGRAPLIRLTDSGPNKVKPDDPGGREFAHTDKKLLNRLSEPGAPPASEAEGQDDRAGDDPNAPRKVRIIPIAPGASAATPARPTSGPVTVSVPGVMLENLGPPAAQAQMPPSPMQPPAMRPARGGRASRA